jgi:DNA end-binding protein Ku
MASAHAVWKGFLEFFLVSVPVRAYSATTAATKNIRLNLLHADCLSPIRYSRRCPVHGEVPPDQVVKGFEVSTGSYVVLDRSELDSLRPPRSRRIAIAGVVDPSAVPARQYSGRSYFLLPYGPAAQKPYALLRDVLAGSGFAGYAEATLHFRQRLVLVQPAGKLLTLSVLHYAEHMVDCAELESEVTEVAPSQEELRLGRALAESAEVSPSNLSEYRDTYQQGLAELVELKARGEAEAAAGPPDASQPPVSLVETLLKSIELAAQGQPGKPPMMIAPSTAEGQDHHRETGLTGGEGA